MMRFCDSAVSSYLSICFSYVFIFWELGLRSRTGNSYYSDIPGHIISICVSSSCRTLAMSIAYLCKAWCLLSMHAAPWSRKAKIASTKKEIHGICKKMKARDKDENDVKFVACTWALGGEAVREPAASFRPGSGSGENTCVLIGCDPTESEMMLNLECWNESPITCETAPQCQIYAKGIMQMQYDMVCSPENASTSWCVTLTLLDPGSRTAKIVPHSWKNSFRRIQLNYESHVSERKLIWSLLPGPGPRSNKRRGPVADSVSILSLAPKYDE